ncbi:DHH family phosphoesterase [Marinicrinis lubricantis]|uniref:Cyclic-di-AMP phosphodiesterase n=1 Tax=Marinicrinis lubricantis TaxID=2086470 RepID=A0ABW1IQL2_9BACL
MPKQLFNRWHGLHMVWGGVLLVAMGAWITWVHWKLGIIAFLLIGLLFYYVIAAERKFRNDMQEYVLTLTHRIRKAGNEVIHDLPIGILLYNEDKEIEWNNPYFISMTGEETLVGKNIFDLFPMLAQLKDQNQTVEISYEEDFYRVDIRSEDRLLYFTRTTDYVTLLKKYKEEKLAIGIVLLDNIDEVSQGMDDQARSLMLAKVVSMITEWAARYEIYLRRVSSDRFMLLMNQKTLEKLEATKFDILDEVREMTHDYKLPVTLSLGIGSGSDSFTELGQLAQASLDVALGRGGDQAAVRDGQRLSFYGGKSNAVEKRTRVRARVLSHALRDLMKESANVVIMGHRFADMDAVGAAIGILKAARLMKKEGYIVLEGVNPSIERLMEHIAEQEGLHQRFITPAEALQITNARTLAVVVDTHKASMVPEPKVLQQTNRVFVVDHHRRGEEFINDATLIYMEPYASSACELVTELLQYFQERIELDDFEATVLLAGIVVDTKSFSLRTGARTFEAASFLRRNGADSALVQQLLKESLEEYLEKADIIKHTEIVFGKYAVAVHEGNRSTSQLTAAKTADTLLNMEDVEASFVIYRRADGLIGISARSLGDLNVQVIMEQLGGGGHLTNAATQLEGSAEDARRKLMNMLERIVEEERESE